jgi:4-hydroxy-2-oxoheptanedioate aldolase
VQATDTMIAAAKRNKKILGLFLFGTDRVAEFIKKGYVFISIGNDLHHIMTQAQTHIKTVQAIAKAEKKVWNPRPSAFL